MEGHILKHHYSKIRKIYLSYYEKKKKTGLHIFIYTGVPQLPECDITGTHNVHCHKKYVLCVVFYSFSCSGNDVTTLLEPLKGVTGTFVMAINVPYNKSQHVGVLKTTSRSKYIILEVEH